MRRFLAITLALVLCLSLFSSCGKSRADKLMDKYTELANSYTEHSRDVASTGDLTSVAKFSRLGIDLTDIATSLSKDGATMTEEELDGIEAKLSEIEAKISEMLPKEE